MNEPLGHCYWAVAPFVPAAPFSLHRKDASPKAVPDVASFVRAAERGESEFVVLTRVKVRPILVISKVLAPHDEVLALRLHRLEKEPAESVRKAIREGHEGRLFYLKPERFPGLKQENAVILSSLLRIAVSAIDRQSLGRVDDNELRVIHERLARVAGLKLDYLVLQKAKELLARETRS